jgi:hypothetical protein
MTLDVYATVALADGIGNVEHRNVEAIRWQKNHP